MEIRCPSCNQSQGFDENQFGNQNSLDVRCAACGASIHATNPKTKTLIIDATKKSVPSITSQYTADGRLLRLPEGKSLGLKVLEGNDKGTVYDVGKPRLTIGRNNSDIIIDDPLASRVHCAIEVMDDWVLLRDLESTNGTIINNQRISASTISAGSVFRVGNHVFELLVTPKQK